MRGPISDFLLGLKTPFIGTKIIFSSKKYFFLSLIPFLLGFFFLFLGFFLTSEYLTPLLQSWLNLDEYQSSSVLWIKILANLFLLIYWMIIGLFNFFFGYLCIIIFGGPFYGILVEAIFQNETNNSSPKVSLKIAFKMILIGILKVFVFATVGLLCFVLSFLPLLNFFVPVIIYLIIAFDCMDYVFEVELFTLKQRFKFFLSHIMIFMGLGCAIFMASLIPGAFFIMLPIFISGATKIYIQLSHSAV